MPREKAVAVTAASDSSSLTWYHWLLPPPRFAQDDEADYLYHWRLDQALRLQRLAGWLACLMYFAGLFSDKLLGTRLPDPWLFWPYALLSIGLSLFMTLGTYLPSLRPRAYSIAFFTLLVNGCTLISVVAYTRASGNGFPAEWTLVLLIYIFVITGLPYRLCVPLGVSLGALNILVAFAQQLPVQALTDQVLVDFSMMLMGVIACSTLERNDRLSWMRSRLMQAQSWGDDLTGMRNRRYLFEEGAKRILVVGEKDQPIAVLMLDIDFFKRLNDSLGHAAGDQCLRQLAAPMKLSRRHRLDIAARLGGEEFAVLLFACDQASALKIAEALRADLQALALANPAAPLGVVTVSIGVASSEALGKIDLESLLLAADRALYRAKAEGRNRVSG